MVGGQTGGRKSEKNYFYGKKNMRQLILTSLLLLGFALAAQTPFKHDLTTPKFPWTGNAFDNAGDQFQFAIVSDRTGGHRPGVFGYALKKLNRMHPEFVMSVGDLIEGYTTDQAILDQQWAEFDSILNHLDTRFFALPGNHDISNDVMRQRWLERYGRSYYHFRYKDVLFLAFDSNDGDGVMFSKAQLDYFKQVLAQNQDVRWTMLFMHHPIWNYRDFNGFSEIEDILKNRPYTVFAGHNHRYFKTIRQERNYYILASTGGGSQLRGPRLGEFDHVTWVTLTDKGPDLLHLQLSGLVEDDVLTDNNVALATILTQASRIEHLTLKGNADKDNILLRFSNQFDPASFGRNAVVNPDNEEFLRKELLVEGRFYHNHHLLPNPHSFSMVVPVDSVAQLAIEVERVAGVNPEDIDNLELEYTVSFEGTFLAPPYRLSGVKTIDFDYPATGLILTDQDIFLDQHTVHINAGFPDAVVRYTLDGSEPGPTSPIYTQPIQLSETTTVKARYFSADNLSASTVVSKIYKKSTPLPPANIKPKSLQKGLRYTYYEGEFTNKVPDFSLLSPKDQGIALDGDPGLIAEKNNQQKDFFAIQFEGFIEIPEDGVYTFYTYSDDGSLLYLHDQLVVDNDGSHSARLKSGYIALKKGFVPIRIGYFEHFLGETLRIGLVGSDGSRKEISFAELWHKK